MTSALIPILNALLPVLIIITLGLTLKRQGFLDESGWKAVEKLSYHVFFPAVTIMSLVKIDLATIPLLQVGASFAGGIFLMTLLLFALKPALHRFVAMSNPAFTSLFQGATRWNSFVGIALCITLYGNTGLIVVSIALLVVIPIVNVLGVVVLAKYGRGEAFSLSKTLVTLIKNPFIWSTLVGLVLSLLKLPFPKFIMVSGDILAQAALATGLLFVGAGLNFSGLQRLKGVVLVAIILKLFFSPLFVYLFGSRMGLAGDEMRAMLICAGVPTASASYILAKAFGGDAEVMAEIITLQTVFAIITLPIWLIMV